MRLQRQTAYKWKGRTYYKYVITLPAKTIEKLGWKNGTELTTKTKDNKLILEAT